MAGLSGDAGSVPKRGDETISHANSHAVVVDHGGKTGTAELPESLVTNLPRYEEARRAAEIALRSLDDDKAFDLVVIDLSDHNVYAETLIIASGRSDRHVGALAAHVVEKLGKNGIKGVVVEGDSTCDWVLLDTGDIVIHIFRPEIRSFYRLEKMWGRETPEPPMAGEAFLHEADKTGALLDA